MSNNNTTNADGSGTFYDFIALCKEIEKEPSYNNKTELVKTFIKNHDKIDLYLLCKLLCCKDDKRVYNMKEKQLVKVLSRIWKSNHADMISDLSNGDFTETAKKFFEESETSAKRSTITLKEVDTWLDELTKITKEDDQVSHFSKFLPKCTSMDLKFICKIMAHDLKINIGSKFVLNALHPKAFDAYTHSHNLKKVIEKIQKQELDDENNNDDGEDEVDEKGKKNKPGLKKGFSVGTSVMSPIKPMLARPCDGAEECVKRCKNGMYVEIKYDGERVQIHKNGDELAFYSRNLKPVKEDKVEQVRESLPQAVEAETIILDGEILLMDTVKHVPLPFGTIGKNKKKKFTNAAICFFAFDILYLNGESLIDTPLDKRKKILAENVKVIQDRIEIGEYVEATKAEEVDKEMLRVMADGLEGLVIKDTKGIYKPNMRHWLKLKKDYLEGGAMADSVDLVVVGLYYGKGNKAGLLSTFLMATFDEGSGQWKTVCKAGSGFDLKTLKDIQDKFDLEKIERQADKVPYWLDCNSTLAPDYVVADPLKSFVFEIRGTSFSRSIKHTANAVSIRFPRIVKIRDDKDPDTATNLKEFDLIVSKSILVDSDPKEEEEQGEEDEAEEDGDDDDEPKDKKKTPAKPKAAPAAAAAKNQPKITAFAKTNNNNNTANKNTSTSNKTNNNTNTNNDSDEEMAEVSSGASITKVEGDVTRPQVHQANEARAILHIVDNSGKWPQRGVFGAISRAYPEPEKAYTSTATLKLGSIVTSKVSNTQDEGKLFVLSLLCQSQTKNGIPPFNMKAFDQCLFGVKSLCDYKKITSVHVPKFDAAIPDMDWKQVEHKFTETLASHGIAVYVYEFGSKSPVKTSTNNGGNSTPAKKVTGVKRPLEDEDHTDEPPQKKAKANMAQTQPQNTNKASNKKKELFSRVHVMFYGSCDNDKDLLSGAILADGGDVMKDDDDFTVATHLVTDDAWDGMIDACLATNSRLKVVRSQWLLDSIENNQLLDVKKYFVKKPAK